MPEQLPQVSYSDQLAFTGSLVRGEGALPISTLRVTRPKYRYPSEMRFSFEYEHSNRDQVMGIIGHHLQAEFRGAWRYHGAGVMMQSPSASLSLRVESDSAGQIQGSVVQMDLGAEALPWSPSEQSISIHFTPTPLAFPSHTRQVLYRSGETWPLDGDVVREPFVIPTGLGTLELTLAHQKEAVLVDATHSEAWIPIVAAHVLLSEESTTPDLTALLDRIASSVAPLESVLSFLSRRHVQCCDISITSSAPPSPSEYRDTTRYRRGYSTPAPGADLVDARHLEVDSIAKVVSALKNSPYSEVIKKTIGFLISYWNSSFPEDQITNGFTALETIVNGISEVDGTSKSLGDDMFEELKEHLRDSIKEFAQKRGLDSATRSKLYEKLPELQRPGLPARTIALVDRYSIPWLDLWPTMAIREPNGVRRCLTRAYARRSAFVHAGHVEDYGTLLSDAASVHATAEMLVYRLLACEVDWLSHSSYWYARGRP